MNCLSQMVCYDRVICYFNILDVCVGYSHIDGMSQTLLCTKYIIDQGHYLIPNDICPIGRNAEFLMQYAIRG